MPTLSIPNNRLEVGSTDVYSGGTDKVFYCDSSGKVQLLPYTFPTSDGLANQVLKTDGSNTLSWVSSAVQLAIGDAVTGGGANQVLYEDGSNQLASSASFTFNGTTLTAPHATFSGGVTITDTNNAAFTVTTDDPITVFTIDTNGTPQVISTAGIFPGTGSTYDLGKSGVRWANVYTDSITAAGGTFTGAV